MGLTLMLAALGLATGCDDDSENKLQCTPHFEPQRTNDALAVSRSNDDVVYVGVEQRGIYVTRDGGETWRLATNGLRLAIGIETGAPCMDEPFQMWVSPTDPDRACMSMSGQPNRLGTNGPAKFAGLYCTSDGGALWTQRIHESMSSAISSMAVVDSNPDIIYAGANTSLQDGERSNVSFTLGIVYKTIDGGATWEELPTGVIPNLRAFSIQLDQSHPSRLFVAMRAGVLSDQFEDEQLGVLRSDDGGATFVSLTNGFGPQPADRAIRHLFISPNAPNRLFASSMGSPSAYVTDDAGDTWTSIPENGAHGAWDPNDAEGDRLLLADAFSRTVRQSLDGGATFEAWGTLPEEYGSNPRQVRKLVFGSTPGRIYAAGTHASVLRSDDDGVTWRVILEEGALPGQ